MSGPSTAFTYLIKLQGRGNFDREFVKPAGLHRINRSIVDALVVLVAPASPREAVAALTRRPARLHPCFGWVDRHPKISIYG